MDLFMKQCTDCLVFKLLDAFSTNNRNKTNGKQSKCKDCNRKYYLENQQKIKERVSNQYHENHEEILKRREKLRQRLEAKKIKAEQDSNYYFSNKLYISEYYKEWVRKNKNHLRAYQSAYKFKRLQKAIENGNNTLTTKEINELLIKHPYCEYCKSTKNLSIDHIIPIIKGGSNSVLNVTVACRSCNSSKNDKLLQEWINRRK